ncbi:hypothetical protein Clacol_005528 [Clathrus columnatus]|uniref:Uncharacterized protein n=1 Tax=Clathrus columnatus TaxID=1419009 RepID=A0AAV5A9K9_9AGAM|nr:hypothetical protein Clacol_005528 [Clathrus columnatus]
MSSSNNSNNTATPGPKVVGNQAKKQDEPVTRQGTQKMKFVPTLPTRRKKAE